VLDSYHAIFTKNLPLLDVRAPVEFQQGAFPTASNLPILDDLDREQIGICYKNQGPEAATLLGHKLVQGEKKDRIIRQWIELLERNPATLLYCFRGGQRSSIAQKWLSKAGYDVKKIEGGYKALRQSLLQVFTQLPKLVIISGRTGTGKTALLIRAPAYIDLEGRANHRGSAFGSKLTLQPTQINFENMIAIDLLKSPSRVFVEDEGRLIGRLNVPQALQDGMKKASILLLEDSVENRVDRIFQEYVLDQLDEYAEPTIALSSLQEKYEKSLFSIRKRLGGIAYKEASGLMLNAFNLHRKGDSQGHKKWIALLLTQYYDPMYDYQLEQKQDRIIASGSQEDLLKVMNKAHNEPSIND
jgi:tRNA 2-selenouridine synthase